MSEDLKPREEPLFPDDDVADARPSKAPAQNRVDETNDEDESSSEVLEALDSREQNPAPPEPEKKRPRKKRVALMIALPLALAIGGGYFWLTSGRYISTEDAYVQQDKVNVVPEVAGRIVKVGAGENQPVTTGDLLFAIDDAQYRVAVDQAKAAVASARLEVERMKAAYASAVADKESADQSLTFAEDTFNRQDRLHDRGFVSQSALDKARLDLQQAQAKARSAEQSVMSAKAALAGNPDIATDDHPEVMQALAKLEAAELDLDHTVVTAPANGIVSQTDRLRVGQYVTSGTSVLSLVETDEVWVEANYKETELTYMREGQPVEIDVDTYPDHPLKGRVASVGAGTGSEFSLLPAQNATGNWVKVVQRIPVRIAIADLPKDVPLRTGMSVSATVDTGRSPELPEFVEKGLAFLGFDFPTTTAQAHETVAAQGVTQH
ncbi:HlyD family secretion protein [Afifella sp. JA880]|uniref:HlyD family secretion protein n=1 Tax=Afifella sp. JA880 TaxID=2975280 RepID=UPI0021BA44FE|nr:HlyD family secretion protein [Afifella sp. JA880]MCT8266716.1 HlyD family secretion protein [Afifella sp. JA880]